ncbi:Agc/grk/bark protein kinase, partial [Globisporangium splendens]
MDELHDAIQDAQYIGAVTNAHRGPSAAFYNPSQSELNQFVEKQERASGSDWLSLENILDQPLGFYFMRRFCDSEQHGVRKLDFLTEVTKYRSLVSADQRFARAREIWDQFCVVPPQFGSSLAGPTGPTDTSASPVSTVTSSPAPTLSSRSLVSPSDNEGGEIGRSGSSRFTLGSLKDLNVASITTNGIIFWRKGESTVQASEVAGLYRECASKMCPIGVGGEVTQRIGNVIKRKAPPSKCAPGSSSPCSSALESDLGGRSSASPTASQSTNGRSHDKGSLTSDELKNCPPSLFDELEACVLFSLEQMHLKDFRSSVFHRRLLTFLFLQTKRVTEEDFTVLRVLGRGGFGMVNGCIKRTSASLYAMKVMNKKMIKKKHAEKLCLAERKILAMISSPFVVCLKYAFQTPEELFLVLDLRTGGDLSFHLNRSRFTENQVRYWAAQILLGLQHLHEKNIVYRDLKPENILLDEKGNCSISDLGLAVEVTPTLAGRCGTRGYWAPEMLLRDENGQRMVYNHAVDWWSYGCLVYELLYGKCPFRTSKAKALHGDKQQAYDKATLELTPSYDPKYFSPEATELIQQLLIRDPAKRLGANGAAEVKRMKFFDPVDWIKMENMAVNPPFVPDNEINAASQADIGSFDIAVVKGVKISDQDQAAYSSWDFVCPETFQREAIEYLEWEVKHDERPSQGLENRKPCWVSIKR